MLLLLLYPAPPCSLPFSFPPSYREGHPPAPVDIVAVFVAVVVVRVLVVVFVVVECVVIGVYVFLLLVWL